MGVQFVQSWVWFIQKLNKAEHTMYLKKSHKSFLIFLRWSDFEIIYFSSKWRRVIHKNNEYKYHKNNKEMFVFNIPQRDRI